MTKGDQPLLGTPRQGPTGLEFLNPKKPQSGKIHDAGPNVFVLADQF